ncbi:MAG: 2-oxoacid:acceptor oxidoreductase subunit alpha [bacterium]
MANPNPNINLNILIGGAAGQGVQTIGTFLAKMLFRSGLYVFCLQDYQSRIKGGENSFRVRLSNNNLTASVEKVDILVVLHKTAYTAHLSKVVPGGIILYDAGQIKPPFKLPGIAGIPMEEISKTTGGDKSFTNMVALGAIGGILGFDLQSMHGVIEDKFTAKGKEIVDKNLACLKAGYEHAHTNYYHMQGITLPLDARFIKRQNMHAKSKRVRTGGRVIMNGTESAGFGMLNAGLKFYAAYPMSPSTGMMVYLAGKAKKFNILVEQAEDEIAAIQMALGASFAGARSAVGTSGGGFSLMVESLSLAGITETPLVIYIMQRPGPATGLPTRTEQADLEFAVHAGHGEFPRFVFAPGDPLEMFTTSINAFNLADKYQVPVLILGDQYLSDSYRVFDMPDITQVRIEKQILPSSQQQSQYKRYKITDNGVSPRAIPGFGKGLVIADSDEHDEQGHLTEDLNMRILQVNKRMKKTEAMHKEIPKPTVYGDYNAEVRLICWGSTLGILQEVVDRLRKEARSISAVHFNGIWPFPKEDAARELLGASRLIVVENNSQAQLARIIQAELGIEIREKILKYNGMQFFPEEVIAQIYGTGN